MSVTQADETNRTPKITLIVASLNGKDELRPLLESYRKQTYQNKELIFMDGGSTDGTLELMEEYRSIIDYGVSEPDEGVMDAWNKALPKATGDWIHFLGGGDYLYDENVYAELVEKCLGHSPESKVVYGYSNRIDAQGQTIEVYGEPWDRRTFREISWRFSHQATLQHCSLFEEYGFFDTSPPLYHKALARDYELLLRYLKDHDAAFVPMVITCEDTVGVSSLPENKFREVLESRRTRRQHKVAKWHLQGDIDLCKAVVKYALWKILPYRSYLWFLDSIRVMRGMPKLYSR